jgi:hypothetical protein
MKQSKRTPIGLLALTIVGLWLFIAAPSGVTTINISTDSDIFKLPDFPLNVSLISGLALAAQVIAFGVSAYLVRFF